MKKRYWCLFLFCSAQSSAQSISGLYAGKLINDSTKREQNYELALSEYRDKITGYSYTTFVVHDTFYYSIKRVKAVKSGGDLIIEDDQMIANNFPEVQAKRVKQTNAIPLNTKDTLTELRGEWKTNKTKEYYSIHGSLHLERDNDSAHSALIEHLKELHLIPSAATQTVKNEKIKKEQVKERSTVTVAPAVPPYLQRQQKRLETLEVEGDSLGLAFYDNGVVDGDVISVYVNGQNVIAATKLTEAAIKKTVYLNTVTADSVQLTLVAETLGSIPPNTGLLVVQDGAHKYELRFSADLQTNATVIFKKRKK